MKYSEKESVKLEFKRQLPAGQQIAKIIVSFCNQYGGKLVIGIDDNLTICGIDEKEIDTKIDSLQQSIYRSCTPIIIPEIYTQRIQDKLLLIIEVSAGMNKPYFITALGLQEGTFIRVGAHTVKATNTTIDELKWKSKGFAADEIPIYSGSEQDIDVEKFLNFTKEHRSTFKDYLIDEQLSYYKIVMEEHKRKYPSIAGILLFGKDPQRFIPESFIICSHFSGIDGRDVNATIDCTGDLFSQLSTAINFVTSRLNKQFVITKIKRSQTLEIPEVALREIIINAIVHRDYSISGSIKIAIYDDRVEIFSPGSFPGPINVNQLETGVTYIRNHTICKLFREAGYIEKLGSGFLTLFKSYRDYQLAEPQVIEGNHFIKCILPRSPRADDHDPEDPKKLLIKLFASNNQISASEIANELTISRQTAARWLSTLVKEKKIKVIGKGPATRYQKLN